MADEFKIQISARGPKDTLYNIRGDDVEEVEAILARLRESGDPAIVTMMEALPQGAKPAPKPKVTPTKAAKPDPEEQGVPRMEEDEEEEEEEQEDEDEEDEDEEDEEDEDGDPTRQQIRVAKSLGITGYSKLTSNQLEKKITATMRENNRASRK